jgi:hypothetical protein
MGLTMFNDTPSQKDTAGDPVRIGGKHGQPPYKAMPAPMLVPTRENESDLAYDATLHALMHNVLPSYDTKKENPPAVSVYTSNSSLMSVNQTPSCRLPEQRTALVPVPLKLIPMARKDITDRHLRETYRYYKCFLDQETMNGLAIAEWPEGTTEKQRWNDQILKIGREIRFLGRKMYQQAVQDTIIKKGLVMSCGQTGSSWNDCLRALFNPNNYTDKIRDLVYWIQFGLLKEGNNNWIQNQETSWCSSYGIKIVYDRHWEGNAGHESIDQKEHGKSYLPFERARASWFKTFFLRGANEIREAVQNFSLRAHDIYERICLTKSKQSENRLCYTKRRFAHGDGFIAEPLEKRRKQELSTPVIPASTYTLEGITAWLKEQGSSMTLVPATLHISTAVNSEMSSMTRSGSRQNSPLVGISMESAEDIGEASGDSSSLDNLEKVRKTFKDQSENT